MAAPPPTPRATFDDDDGDDDDHFTRPYARCDYLLSELKMMKLGFQHEKDADEWNSWRGYVLHAVVTVLEGQLLQHKIIEGPGMAESKLTAVFERVYSEVLRTRRRRAHELRTAVEGVLGKLKVFGDK